MHISRLSFLHVVLFGSITVSCRQPENREAIATVAKQKTDCTTCKAPSSRAALLKASLKEVTADSSAMGKEEMVYIKGGTYQMGATDFADSKPVHSVSVSSFWMDEHEVTNAEFSAFVKATGYKTIAEQEINPADFPGVEASQLVPGSAVFTPPAHQVSLDDPMQWWHYIPGANWKHPFGPSVNTAIKDNEPVVQVCYTDAAAYAKWAGKRLPTEAEWEYAARAGKSYQHFYWGNELKPGGKWMANIFQGSFPWKNANADGYVGVAPVKSYPPNGFGLFDMDGNVWEWCSDFYRPDYYEQSVSMNPKGPKDSYDPTEPGLEKHVQRGGSFLCSDDYCIRYRAGSRGKGETSSAGNNLGFRCVRDAGN